MIDKKQFEDFKYRLKNKGLKPAITKGTQVFYRDKIVQPLYDLYTKFRSKYSEKIINKPYEVIDVPTEKITYSLSSESHPYSKRNRKSFLFTRVRVVGHV